MTLGKQFNKQCGLTVGTALASAFIVAHPPVAQAQIDEIVVTAQKRAENVQQVPIAISAFNSESLALRGVTSAQDLQFLAPGLTVGRTNAGQARVTIRGVGAENIGVGGDPGVAFYVDGHYLQSSNYVVQDFFDVERVEVLRGPQGTLYGRNTIGGAINVITRRPAFEFEAEAGVELKNYEGRKFRGVVNLPITDALALRVVGVTENREGYTENISTGQKVDQSDYHAVRGSLLFNPTDDIEVLLSGYHYENNPLLATPVITPYPTGPVLSNGLTPNPFFPALNSNPTAIDRREIRNDTPTGGGDDAVGASLDLTWEIDQVTLKSLSSFNVNQNSIFADAEGSDFVTSIKDIEFETETFSQEVQFNYAGERIDLVSGLYYYREDSSLDVDFIFNYDINPFVPIPLPNTIDIATIVDGRSYGAYAQGDARVADWLTVTAGIRWTRDEKKFLETSVFPEFFVSGVQVPQEDSWEDINYRVGLSVYPNDDVLLFLSYATGYKSGGFNSGGLQAPYRPETVESVEGGLKSQWLDNRLQVNVTAFHSDYEDKQEFQVSPLGVGTLLNAGKARMYGAEAEMLFVPIESLQIDGAISYLNAKYDEFFTFDDLNLAAGLQNFAGNRLTRAPEWKFNVGAQYTYRIPNAAGSLTARADFVWVDDIFYRPANLESDREDAYHRTNLRLAWVSESEKIRAAAFVENLENDDIVENKLLAGGILGQGYEAEFFPPRTYGFSLDYRF